MKFAADTCLEDYEKRRRAFLSPHVCSTTRSWISAFVLGGAAWVPSSTYSSEFVVSACLQITVTRSMGQSHEFWKCAKMLGSINWTKSDYICFVAPMIGVDASCSAPRAT